MICRSKSSGELASVYAKGLAHFKGFQDLHACARHMYLFVYEMKHAHLAWLQEYIKKREPSIL